MTAPTELDAVAAALAARLPDGSTRAVPARRSRRIAAADRSLSSCAPSTRTTSTRSPRCRRPTDVPVLVIGRGSNLLVADAGFAGVAIVLGGEFEHIDVDPRRARREPRRDPRRAGGAAPLPVLARQAAKAGIGGLEFFVGIPGASAARCA